MGTHADEHLRRFLAARRTGDAVAMRRWWDALVIDIFDRMDGLVAAAHRGRLDDDEHELAVQLAMARFSRNLVETFRGSSMGELVNATKTLARGICMDVQRRSIRVHEHETVSLDAGWDTDGDGAAAGGSWRDADEAERRLEREQRSAEIRDFLAWALPRVKETNRRVVELTIQGAELREISAELGITEANAYQRRSRGLRDLKQLKEQWGA